MQPEFQTLPMTAGEIERYSGLEVSELFVGNIVRGIYRPSIFRSPGKLLAFGLTELAFSALIFIFCLPFGFAVLRDKTSPWLFLTVTGTATGGVVLSRHVYRLRAGQALQPLMQLLDRVDQFNDLVQALAVREQLGTLQPANLLNYRAEMLAVVQQTRENLLVGLRTEKILRDNWGLIARRRELLTSLEHHLLTLEDNFQALNTLSDWL